MNIAQIKSISIPKVLAHFGVRPSAIKGNSYWYHSWEREEDTPSVRVDLIKNLYIDYGTGNGGSVIDAVLTLSDCREVSQAINFLNSFNMKSDSNIVATESRSEGDLNLGKGKIEIVKVHELRHKALIKYLQRRRVDDNIAKQYCQEVHYTNGTRKYFSIGFKNDGGGFELRNSIFKNCTSPKGPTWIKNQSTALIIMEGFIDFISLLTISNERRFGYDFLVLNSLAFVERIRSEFIQNYDNAFLFLDNDQAGEKATHFFLSLSDNVTDCSMLYKGYKDVNDWLMNRD